MLNRYVHAVHTQELYHLNHFLPRYTPKYMNKLK